MCQQDRQPLANTAGADRITPTANDRLGFGGVRRDAYSLIFFNHEPSTSIENDFTSSPDELLTAALEYEADGGTDFTRALERAQYIMDSHWSNERYGLVLEKGS
jgi:hypothetical protein